MERERSHFEVPGLDGRVLLKWIFRSGIEDHGTD
jgi:hypothetical protein